MNRYDRTTREISAHRGQPFIIALEALPSAGYTWRVTTGLDLLRIIQHAQVLTEGAVGTAVIEEVTLEGMAVGKTTLSLEFARSWESDVTERISIPIVISG